MRARASATVSGTGAGAGVVATGAGLLPGNPGNCAPVAAATASAAAASASAASEVADRRGVAGAHASGTSSRQPNSRGKSTDTRACTAPCLSKKRCVPAKANTPSCQTFAWM